MKQSWLSSIQLSLYFSAWHCLQNGSDCQHLASRDLPNRSRSRESDVFYLMTEKGQKQQQSALKTKRTMGAEYGLNWKFQEAPMKSWFNHKEEPTRTAVTLQSKKECDRWRNQTWVVIGIAFSHWRTLKEEGDWGQK